MQRQHLVPWLVVALGGLASFPSAGLAPPPPKFAPPAPVLATDAVAKLARSSNTLGFDLYQRLRKDPGNLVISPASITTALIMAWGGAEGETAAQMRRVLHLEGTRDDVMAAAADLERSLQDPARPLVFHIANGLFSEKSYTLVPAYQEKMSSAFGAPVELLDFKHEPENARAQINHWIESKTANRIQDLIPPGGVGPDSRLVLANAIYFLGNWRSQFSIHETAISPFHVTASESKDVPTMNALASLRISEEDGLTAVEILYKGGTMSMMLLVPVAVDGLAAIESRLDAKMIGRLVGAMQLQEARLSLPSFELSPTASLPLGKPLKALGMSLVFDRRKADFSGIANPPEPAERPVIGEVFHKGFVKVDEHGTEAAAATEVMISTGANGSGGSSEPRRIQVDRPFLFLIRDNSSGLVLFLGRVSDPSRR